MKNVTPQRREERREKDKLCQLCGSSDLSGRSSQSETRSGR